MASAPFRNDGSRFPQGNLEEMLMFLEKDLDAQTFYVEYEKKGPGFIVAAVRHRKTFQESFDRLVGKGCRPDILFLGLHYLLRSELHEKSCQLPRKREIRSLEASLRKAVDDIQAFEKKYADAHRLRVLNHCFSFHSANMNEYELYFNQRSPFSQAKTPSVTDNMLAYAEMLRSWWTPRSLLHA